MGRSPSSRRLSTGPPRTTRNHLSSIIQKLGVHSRMETIRVAEERGWL